MNTTCYARKSTCCDIEMHLLCSVFHLILPMTDAASFAVIVRQVIVIIYICDESWWQDRSVFRCWVVKIAKSALLSCENARRVPLPNGIRRSFGASGAVARRPPIFTDYTRRSTMGLALRAARSSEWANERRRQERMTCGRGS